MSSKYNYEHPMVEQAHSRLAVLDAAQRLAFGVGAQDTRTSGILSVNPALAAMLGRTPSDMRNMLVPELFDETNRRVYLEQMQERTLGRHAHYRIEMLVKGGGSRKLLVVPSPVFVRGALVAEVAAMLPAAQASDDALRAAQSFVKSLARGATRGSPERALDRDRAHVLSDRECDCMLAARAGRRRAEIAEALAISVRTVHEHIRASARKLGLPSTRAVLEVQPCGLCGRSDCEPDRRLARWRDDAPEP